MDDLAKMKYLKHFLHIWLLYYFYQSTILVLYVYCMNYFLIAENLAKS